MKKKIYCFCLLALFLAVPAIAQEVPVLKAIKVEGSAAAIEQRTNSVSAKVVLEREEIKRMADRTVGDVLRRLPGISYSGPPGVTKDVRMRGMDKGYTQILINGEQMGSAKSDRQMQVNRIPADMIERIEIIRTPTADIDSQGIGGTINIILKEAEQKPFGQIRLGGGYTDKIPSGQKPVGEVGVQFGGGSENFSYLFNANLVERAENKGEEKRKYKSDGSLNEMTFKDENSDVRDLTLAPRLSWQSDVGKLSLDPFYANTNEDKNKTEYQFKGDGSVKGTKIEEEEKDNEIFRVRLGWEQKLNEALTLSWHGTGQQASVDAEKAATELNPDGSLKKTTTENKFNEETLFSSGVELKWLVNDFHVLRLGGEWQNRQSEAEKVTYENGALKAADAKGLFTIDELRWTLYASDEWLISEKHLLTPGLRVEFYETEAQQSGGTTNTSSNIQPNPSLQYRYQWADNTVFRAGIARTLRLPKFEELNPFLTTKDGNLSKPDVGGTPDLEPETALGYDTGIEYLFTGGKGIAGVNFFYRDISDLIESVSSMENSRWVSRPQNVGDAKLWGVELDLSRQLDFISMPNSTLWGNYTWLDSQINSTDGSSRPMKDVPDYILNLGFDQEIPRWDVSFGVALNVLGPIDTSSPKDSLTELKTESRKELVDLYILKRFGKSWQLSFNAYNIFEDDKNSEKRIMNSDGSLKESESNLETSARTFMITLEKRF